MSAKLWEDTVVTAVRDEKWLHALRHQKNTPLPQVKLKGNAEQRLGDIIDASNDRFFLLEVKGVRGDIKDEWDTNNSDKNHQKDAYRAHVFWTKNSNDQNIKSILRLSLQGHLFAYWVEFLSSQKASESPDQWTWRDLLTIGECVAIEPYALACRTFMDKQPDDAKFGKFNPNIKMGIWDSDRNEFVCRQQIPLSLAYEDLGYLIEEVQTTTNPAASNYVKLGLKLDDFRTYISNLCSFFGKNAEPIHAIVMSSSGDFFRIVTTTAELEDLLGSSPKIDSKKLPWPEHRSPKMTAQEKDARLAELAKGRTENKIEDEDHSQPQTHWGRGPH